MRAGSPPRPSAATDSKMPGETVVPATATRTGWKTSFALTSRRSTTAQRALDVLDVEWLGLLERSARLAQALGGADVAHHLGPGLLVEVAALDQEAGQRPEVGERLHLVLADRHGLDRQLAAGDLLERAFSSSTGSSRR